MPVDDVHIPVVPELRSGSVQLRSLELLDAPVLFETVYGDPNVMRFVADGSHASIDVTRTAIAEYIEHGQQHGFTFWGVEADGVLIGDCGLYLLGGHGPEVEIGITLREQSCGSGIGTLCANACIEYAFEQLGLDVVVAVARAENVASLRLLERVGFERTGTIDEYGHPHERFEVRAASWREAHNAG